MTHEPFQKALSLVPVIFLALVAVFGTWSSSRYPYCSNYTTDLLKNSLRIRYVQYADSNPPKVVQEADGRGHYTGFVGYWEGRTGLDAPVGKHTTEQGTFLLSAFQEKPGLNWEAAILITKPVACHEIAPGQMIFAKFYIPTKPVIVTAARIPQIPGMVTMKMD